MGEECKSRLPQLQFNWQPRMLNAAYGAPLEVGQPNRASSYMNPYSNRNPKNCTSVLDAYSSLPHLQAGQADELRRQFYYLPLYRQAMVPTPNHSTIPSARPHEDLKHAIEPDSGSKSALKRFLVFDKPGDQAAVFVSSLSGNPIRTLASWSPKPTVACDLSGQHAATKPSIYQLDPVLTDEVNGNCGADAESELPEDTEELNALLDSDDDSSDTEDDEIMSTGHSPGTMTAHNDLEWFEEIPEKVTCFEGATKRRRLGEGGYDAEALMDTASSVKPNGSLESNAYDTDSSCADNLNLGTVAAGSLSGKKRFRKEKIHESVSILQSIIPGVKGKNAAVILDEAIQYLKSLELKAKAMGLESF